MAKFHFRLESMKKYRENRLLMAKKELMAIEGQLMDLKTVHRAAVLGRSEEVGNSLRKLEIFSAAQLSVELARMQSEKIRRIEESIRTVEEEIGRHRAWVAQLGQELKIVQKLEEKQRSAFEAEQKLLEKRAGDRWVAERWRGGES